MWWKRWAAAPSGPERRKPANQVSLGGFVIAYFPLFLLGAVFGMLTEASGAAHIIAQGIAAASGEQRAILAVVLACAVLTYGGVSLSVVAFAVYPIAQALFRRADIPRRLMPATIALGAFTFTMTALPGTPAIQNALPMPYFGTTPFAAPGLCLIATAVMLMPGLCWLHWRSAQARSRGEGFTAEDEAQQLADELAPAAEAPSHLELGSLLGSFWPQAPGIRTQVFAHHAGPLTAGTPAAPV